MQAQALRKARLDPNPDFSAQDQIDNALLQNHTMTTTHYWYDRNYVADYLMKKVGCSKDALNKNLYLFEASVRFARWGANGMDDSYDPSDKILSNSLHVVV